MRESIGATWIFSICLTFIILFTAYLAISVNYAKAFKIKSHIVSMIEENEGYTGNDAFGLSVDNYLVQQGYTATGSCSEEYFGENEDWDLVSDDSCGNSCQYCVYRQQTGVNTTAINSNCGAYYKVVVFFKFDLPVVSYFMTFQVKGDTKYIIKDVNC